MLNFVGMERLLHKNALVEQLLARGPRPALLADDRTMTYEELGRAVADAAGVLGPERRLVMLRASNDIGSIVWYLGALAARHPLLLTSPTDERAAAALQAVYRPDVVLDGSTDPTRPLDPPTGEQRDLHPQLALLLSTSGSTGSPKLVRLSRRNLWSNAAAIARYLDLSAADRAMTALPMHYCYGLSVINSHLLAGGSVALNDASALDNEFWRRFDRLEATSFAGVPHTFDLLDRIGFEDLELPRLRIVTVAGGRLDPERVRHHALLGLQRGWRFYAMYGQTEATARMAYLSPERAVHHPATIGVPIPKGSFELDEHHAETGRAEGELVFRGPNVMLGYADGPDDLALGRTTEALRTGDLARATADGSYEIVGRARRIIKPFGLRIDLDQIEGTLAASGVEAFATGDDARLVIACHTARNAERARLLTAESTGLPRSSIVVAAIEDVPRRENGKVDYERVVALVDTATSTIGDGRRPSPSACPSEREGEGEALQRELVELFRSTLGHLDVRPDHSFVDLGGDSLNYVRLSVDLEDRLGGLPRHWHEMSIAELVASVDRERSPAAQRRFRRTETTVVLRATAILLIVATHAGLVSLPGGAHVLLGVAGFNYARFQLRSARPWSSIGRVALPAMAWIGGLWLLTDDYDVTSPLLVHNIVGEPTWSAAWRFWFIDVLVQTLIVATLLMSIPQVRRMERARPFAFAALLLSVALVLRHDLFDVLLSSREGGRTLTALWAFVIGWAAARAGTDRERLLLTVALPVAVLGFYPNPWRVATIAAGLLTLIWIPRIVLPRVATHTARVLGAASLAIYLTHWEVLPLVTDDDGLFAGNRWLATPLTATVLALSVGIAAAAGVERVGRAWSATVGGRGSAGPRAAGRRAAGSRAGGSLWRPPATRRRAPS